MPAPAGSSRLAIRRRSHGRLGLEHRERALALRHAPHRQVHRLVDLAGGQEALAGQQQDQHQLRRGDRAVGEPERAGRERDRDAGARDERHDAPEDGRHVGQPDRRVAHVVGAAEQILPPPARRPEHLQGRHPLQPVDELRGERPVAVGPEAHVGLERAVLDRRDRHERRGEQRDQHADDRVDDPDHDDDRDRRDPRDDHLRQEQPEVHVEPLHAVDEHGLELAAALTRHPGGAEPEDPVDQPATQVRRDPDRGAGHHALLERGADGPEPDQGDREDERRHDIGHRGAVEDAADRDRQRDPRGDPSGGDAEPERHRSGEGAPLGRRQPHQPPVEGARGPVGSRHGGTLASGQSLPESHLTCRRDPFGRDRLGATRSAAVNIAADPTICTSTSWKDSVRIRAEPVGGVAEVVEAPLLVRGAEERPGGLRALLPQPEVVPPNRTPSGSSTSAMFRIAIALFASGPRRQWSTK